MGDTIAALKERCPGVWLAIRITRYEDFQPVEGELVFHHEDWSAVLSSVALPKTDRIYFTYAGPLIPDGDGLAFPVLSAAQA